ncbi:MAG TPA: pyridoxal phosphate-dependent aminotransferase [Firmicutes bacterium]|nr:pyridoxal phosphate-dependent aminotransferase [Bacillota bacterium]
MPATITAPGDRALSGFLASRARGISASPTLAVDNLAKELSQKGVDVVGFGAGEPDFDTPAFIKEAAARALEQGMTKYTAVGGLPELRQAIAAKLLRENGLEYSPGEIVVTVGAKHALYEIFQVLCEPGDEVVLPSPYWVSYLEQVRLAGATPVIVPASPANGLKITPDELRRALTSRTKVVLLNSPNNPTGAVYGRDELAALAEVVLTSNAWIVSDEIYESFVYTEEPHVSIASIAPEVKSRTLLVNGFSKRYAMTGWRLGYVAGAKPVVEAITNLQSHSTSNPTTFAQWGAIAALNGPQEPVQQMVEEFRRRRDFLVERLRLLPGVECARPEGAFYVFPRISGIFGRSVDGFAITSSTSFCQAVLQKVQVAMVPGIAFGADEYVRLSYATSFERIQEGMRRLEAFWQRLTG